MAYYDLLETPLGTLFVGGSEAGLHRIEWVDGPREEAEVIALLEVDADAPAQRDLDMAKPAIEASTDTMRGAPALPAIPIPRKAKLPVINAVKTFPRARKLTASTAPDEIVSALSRPLRTET